MKNETANLDSVTGEEKATVENIDAENVDTGLSYENMILGARAELDFLYKTGESRIQVANESIGLDESSINEVANELGLEKRMTGIKQKGESAFKKIKKSLKKVTAIWVASAAFAGMMAPSNDKSTIGTDLEISAISIANNPKLAAIMEEELKHLLSEQDRLTKEKRGDGVSYESGKVRAERRTFLNNEIDKVREKIYKIRTVELEAGVIRKELRDHLASKDYLDKLVIEFGGDIEKAKIIQKERIAYLDETTIVFTDFEDKKNIQRLYYNKNNSQNILPNWWFDAVDFCCNIKDSITVDGMAGWSNVGKKRVFVPMSGVLDLIYRHELGHASTKDNKGIPRRSRDILSQANKTKGDGKNDSYYGKPTEKLVRKRAVELDMEKYGIKKYGEKFTHKHYLELIERYKNKPVSLSYDTIDFIETTKPEFFERIFNEIALNEQGNGSQKDVAV